MIRKYQKGDIIPRSVAVPFLYDVENPFRKNIIGNYATSFNDGWARTIGAGVAETSEAPKEWFDGRKVLIEKVDDYAYNHLMNDDKAVRAAYDEKFGTSDFPNPSDTLSIGPRLYAAQNRYQRGHLAGGKQEGINEILSAIAKGNKDSLINAISKWTSSKDTGRVSRVLQAYPEVYNDWDSPKAKTLSKIYNIKYRLNQILNPSTKITFPKEQPKGTTEQLKQGGKMNILQFLKNGSGIHIKKANRGKFTDYCGGKVTSACIAKGKRSPNPTVRKRATFADNARHFKHKSGGQMGHTSKADYEVRLEEIAGFKKGGKVKKHQAFVDGVNILDSDPTAYKYVKKKYKMRQQGGILQFLQ